MCLHKKLSMADWHNRFQVRESWDAYRSHTRAINEGRRTQNELEHFDLAENILRDHTDEVNERNRTIILLVCHTELD